MRAGTVDHRSPRVQKLHLVGTTTDQNGLILSARRGARSGAYTLVIDEALAAAVEELRERQEAEAEAAGGSGANRVESRLPIGEIQARLRRGRSVKDVAKEAGVDPEWVERFAAPVFAEQAEVISRVQGTFYKRQRLGESGMRIGDAVRRNLVERGVVMSPAEITEAWTTHQRPDGRWIVTFAFEYRGAKRLKFEVRTNGDIIASDQLTAQLAYITPPKRSNPRPKPAPVQAADNAGKRAVVSSGFRADKPTKALSRPGKEREKAEAAMSKAAAKRAVEGERAAARKSREREQMMARREREARAEAVRRERELAAQRREAAAAARLAAAEDAERLRAQEAVAAARQAERDAARRSARLKVKAGAKVVAAKKEAASRAAKAPASAAPRKAAPAKASATKSPTRPPRPSAAARVEAPPPGRAAAAVGVAGRPKPAAKPAATPPPRHAAKSSGKRSAAPASRRSQPAARPAIVAPDRAAAASRDEVYEPVVARPQFRSGLAAPADGRDQPTAPTPAVRAVRDGGGGDAAPANGRVARQRPPGVRRARPLRAT